MGTSNFLYRDTLYALDTYVPADEAECTCDHEAIAAGCEHESDCPALNGYHDEFIYDDMKANLIAALDEYRKTNPNYVIYGDDDGWTNDNRSFEGRIIGRIYKDFTIDNEYALGEINFAVGDDFCLRSGYYSGFNFDRVQSRYADNGTDELEAVTDAIHEAIYKYDELRLAEAVENEDLTDEEVEEIKDKLYAEAVAEVESFIAEADRIYHELGEKYFDSYRAVTRASNGETLYEKANA